MRRILWIAVLGVLAAAASVGCPGEPGDGDGDGGPADAGLGPADAGPPDGGEMGDAGPCSDDLMTDPDNCGSCGRGCGEGACEEGVCQPWELVGTQNGPQDVDIDGDTVRWPNLVGVLIECALPGCPDGPSAIVGEQVNPVALDVADGRMYWGTIGDGQSGALFACDLPDCAVVETLYQSTSAVGDVQVVDGTVYFLADAALHKCDEADCAGTQEVMRAGLNEGLNLFVTDGWVYYTERAGGFVNRCHTDDCAGTEEVLVALQQGPLDVTALGQFVYWTNQTGGTVYGCNVTDCAGTATLLAQGLTFPSGIYFDGTHLYFTAFGSGPNGNVQRCTASALGCDDRVVLARDLLGPLKITGNDEVVVWANVGMAANLTGGSLQVWQKD